MSGIETKSCSFFINVIHQFVNFVGKFNVTTGMRMNDCSYFIHCRTIRDSFDMLNHCVPIFLRKSRSTIAVTCRKISFIVTPIHYCQVRSFITLSFFKRKRRQFCNDWTNIINLLDKIFIIIWIDQIIKNGSCNDWNTVLFEFGTHDINIKRKITVRTEFNSFVTCLTCLEQNFFPGRKIRIFNIIDSPAARCACNVNCHFITSNFYF